MTTRININGKNLSLQDNREVIPNQLELGDQQFLLHNAAITQILFGKRVEIARRYYNSQVSLAFGSSIKVSLEASKIATNVALFKGVDAHFFAQFPEGVKLTSYVGAILEAQYQGGLQRLSMYEKDCEQSVSDLLGQISEVSIKYPSKKIIPFLDMGMGASQPGLLTKKLQALNKIDNLDEVGLIFRGYTTNVDNFLQVSALSSNLKYNLHMSGVPRTIGKSNVDGRQIVTLFGVNSVTRGFAWVNGVGNIPRLRQPHLMYEYIADIEVSALKRITGLPDHNSIYKFTRFEAAEINQQSFTALNGKPISVIQAFVNAHPLLVNTV